MCCHAFAFMTSRGMVLSWIIMSCIPCSKYIDSTKTIIPAHILHTVQKFISYYHNNICKRKIICMKWVVLILMALENIPTHLRPPTIAWSYPGLDVQTKRPHTSSPWRIAQEFKRGRFNQVMDEVEIICKFSRRWGWMGRCITAQQGLSYLLLSHGWQRYVENDLLPKFSM